MIQFETLIHEGLERFRGRAGLSGVRMSNRRKLVIALGAVALVSAPLATLAQTYPTKPIRIVVSAAPGGSPDIISRLGK